MGVLQGRAAPGAAFGKGVFMPDKEQSPQSDFMIERIKQRPINRKRLLRRTILTAAMAVIFGMIACITFLVLEPVISNWLHPEEGPKVVSFPEDQKEMSPEEMLAENQATENPDSDMHSEPLRLEDEEIEKILSRVVLDKGSYKELYAAMSDYVAELNQYTVTVTAVTSNVDWFSNEQESRYQSSGFILTDNGKELLILAYASPLRAAKSLTLTFYNNVQAVAEIKQMDSYTNLAVLAVDFANLPDEMQKENMVYPSLSSLSSRDIVGTPVIAVGSPMGTRGSVGYGMITSPGVQYSVPDRNYRIIQTDINGSRNAGGVLFNLEGQVVGIITGNKAGMDVDNVIYAYGISEMRRTLEKLSNGNPIAFLGISGLNVTAEANTGLGVPAGAFVTKVDMDSPAMRAGIQQGDVITGINERDISTFNEYTGVLMQTQPGETVAIKVMRQSQDGYKEMNFKIETGDAKR